MENLSVLCSLLPNWFSQKVRVRIFELTVGDERHDTIEESLVFQSYEGGGGYLASPHRFPPES